MKSLGTTIKTTVTKTTKYDTSIKGLTVIETILNDGEPSYRLDGKGPHDINPTVVKPDFWDFIEKYNPFQKTGKEYDFKYGLSVICNDEELTLEKIEYAVKNNLIVYFYGSGHEAFDINGEIIPLRKNFEYIGTVFSDETAEDLNELKDYLSTHPWVLNKEELEILDVPYYNQGDGLNKYLRVSIKPDKKAYTEMYERAKKYDLWSTKMNDFCINYELSEKYDPMGLVPFLKKNKDE